MNGRQPNFWIFLFPLLAVAGCSGGGAVAPPPPPPPAAKVVTTLTFTAGDGQTVRKGTAVGVSPVVLAKDQNGSPMAGVAIAFAVTGGGTVGTTSATTGADGTAAPGTWTASPTPGPNTLTATAAGGVNPSAQITATARNPLWTVMVYMAADNSLAFSGIDDIDEMEAATNPEVQVVVQAEFSPSALQQGGCSSGCFNRPNFNTFRYVLTGQGPKVFGPNGPVTDIGNRNMTDPAQLRDFIVYAKQTVPAEHYITILWNHGGGYQGLIADETSAPGSLMSVAGLPTALGGVGGVIDVVAFDMCLMGGYETLTKLDGFASNAVFSEEVEPGAGYAYDRLIAGLGANPGMNSKTAAILIADTYDASYVGQRFSTTVSAYDMSGFSAFEGSLNTLATALTSNVATLNNSLVAAAAGAQAFQIQPIKDFGNLLDSLRTQISDPTIRTAIDAAKTSATAFRLQQHSRTGSGQSQRNVNRATGLNILMPSGIGNDRLPNSGTGSLAAYLAILGSKPWAQFLGTWLANKPALGYSDLGNNRYETYLVWDTAAVAKKADVDLFVLEPDGSLYGPSLGTISPNGRFTADSYASPQTYFEGDQFLRFVQTGSYRFYAFLWTDPNNFGPVYNIVYRNSPTAAFSSLYSAPYPRLTGAVRFVNDPNPTLAKIENNQYTDFRTVAVLTIFPNAAGNQLLNTENAGAGSLVHMNLNVAESPAAPQLTMAQIRAVRALAGRRSSLSVLRPMHSGIPLPIPRGERQ